MASSETSLKFLDLCYFRNKPGSAVIAAAARTPWGKYKGQLASVSAWQLGQLVVETAVKQSAIPVEQIQQIFLNEKPKLQKANESKFVFSNFLKKAKYIPTAVGYNDNESKVEYFLNALEFLKSHTQAAVVIAGLESASQVGSIEHKHLQITKLPKNLFNEVSSEILENYKAKCLIRCSKTQTEAIFDSEIVPLKVKQREGKRTIIREINEDEIMLENYAADNSGFNYSDGAAALVLTTLANSIELKLSPLAVITDFEYLPNTSNILSCTRECVEKLLSKTQLDAHQIQHWEIEDLFPQVVAFLKHHFKLNLDLINPHCGSSVFGYSSAASFTRLLTHLTHSLNPLEYGCVVFSSYQQSLALVIQKLPFLSNPERLPLLTLYTKDPCPLCDVLIEELELHFPGEYELEKVFIDTKDNLRYLRLYRLDIPVVFLNNQFLCMHRLNHRLFRKRLDLFNKNKLLN